MADGANRTFVVKLDDAMASQLEQTARDSGFDTETFLLNIVADTLVNYERVDSRTDAARKFQQEQAEIALAEYDRTGVSFPLEDSFAMLDSLRKSVPAGQD